MNLSLNDGIAILTVCATVVSVITSIVVFNILRFGICCLCNKNDRTILIESTNIDPLLDNSLQLEMNNHHELSNYCISYILEDISEECPICLGEMKDTKIIQFDCLHKYHETCALEWWTSEHNNNNYSCLICNH